MSGLWLVPVVWVALMVVCATAGWLWRTLTEGERLGRGDTPLGSASMKEERAAGHSPSVSVPFVEVHEQDGFRAIVFGEAWPGGLRLDRVDVETRT